MKNIVIALLFLGSFAHADVCSSKAQKFADKWFKSYSKEFVKDAKENLEDGEEYNEDSTPTNFDLSNNNPTEDCSKNNKKNCTLYNFEWNENEECACGVSVRALTAKSKKPGKKPTCKLSIEANSQACDCG